LVCCLLVIGCSSKEEKKVGYFERGKAYFEKGEYKNAELELRNAIQIDPNFADAYTTLGETYLKLGNAKKAYQAYSDVAKLDPENTAAHLKLATFLVLGKKFPAAKEKLDIVLSKEPENIEALLMLASALAQEDNRSESAETFQKVIDLDPQKTSAYLGLARLQSMDGKYEEAEQLLKQAVSVNPDDIKIRLALFGFYKSRSNFQGAEAVLDSAIDANPDNSDLYLVKGNYFMGRSEPGKAEAAFLKAMAIDPKSAKPALVSARYYEAVGNGEKALTLYEKALALQPEDVGIMTTIARFHMKNKDYDTVENSLQEVFTLRPNYNPAQRLKGELMVARKQYLDAIGHFDHLLKDDPDAVDVYYYKAIAHLGNGETRVAKSTLLEAVELNPKHIKAKLMLADLYLKDRAFDSAERECNSVLELVPGSQQARFILGTAQFYSKKIDLAEKTISALVTEAPKNPMVHYQMGLIHRVKKENAPALERFESALSLNPAYMEALSQLVQIRAAQGETDTALAVCDRQLEQVGDRAGLHAIILCMKGDLLVQKPDKDSAEKAYQAALAKDPNYMRSYHRLARLYLSEKRADEAIAQYEAGLKQNPQKKGFHMMLGTIYDLKKQPKLSEDHYRAELEINPESVPALNNLAYQIIAGGGSTDEALGFAKKAKELAPRDPRIMDTLGWAYYNKGFYDSAINEFNASLGKMTDNATVHYHLGLAYLKKGETQKAKAALENALGIDPSFADAKAEMEKLANL